MTVPQVETEGVDRRSLHERIAADLRDDIMSGELAPGASLPSTARLKERFDASNATVQKALHLLKEESLVVGMTGLTAYAGLLRVAAFKEGDSVFVSGAAGAVGSQVGQIAKLKGASRVIGSAGSDEKVRLLVDEYGFDAAFNYKDGPVSEQLRAAAPDGVDVYFDNVGGDHLEAAVGSLNLNGRIAVCGMISVYNNTEPAPGPRNLARLIQTRGRIEGFLVGDHYDLQPKFVEEVGPWVRSGELKYRETVVEGIENNLEAFLGVLRGDNTGKMIVKL